MGTAFKDMENTEQPQLKEPELVFESESSYDFIEAAEVLRQANIYFEAEEEYTGEFRPSRRAPPPYIWRIYVSKSDYEAANAILSQNNVVQYTLEIPETSDTDSENSNKTCVFCTKSATDSDRIRPPILIEVGRAF